MSIVRKLFRSMSDTKPSLEIVNLIVTYERTPTDQDKRALAEFDLSSRPLQERLGISDREVLGALERTLDFQKRSETVSLNIGVQSFAHFPILFCLSVIEMVEEVLKLPRVKTVAAEKIGDRFSLAELPSANVLKGLEFCLMTKVGVASISLDPGPLSLSGITDIELEPFNVASRICYEKGLTIVVATGNRGEEGERTISRWGCTRWVVSVGGARPDGTAVQPYSSRGDPNDRRFHPTVVGPDEARRVAPIQTGSSFATPVVATIAADAISFLKMLKQILRNEAGIAGVDTSVTPKAVGRTLQDMARPISGALHERGSGFVDHRVAHHYFKSFNYSNWIHVVGRTEGTCVPEDCFRQAKKKLNQRIKSSFMSPYPWDNPVYLEIDVRRYSRYRTSTTTLDFADRPSIAQIDVAFGQRHPVQIRAASATARSRNYRGVDITIWSTDVGG